MRIRDENCSSNTEAEMWIKQGNSALITATGTTISEMRALLPKDIDVEIENKGTDVSSYTFTFSDGSGYIAMLCFEKQVKPTD